MLRVLVQKDQKDVFRHWQGPARRHTGTPAHRHTSTPAHRHTGTPGGGRGGGGYSQDIQEADAEPPFSVEESVDGKSLKVMFSDDQEEPYQREAAAAYVQSPDPDPLVRKWLTGTPLIRLIKYDP